MFLEDTNHYCVPVSDEELEDVKKIMPLFQMGAVRIKPEDLLVASIYTKFADAFYNFKFHEGDVMVAGYPKSGTTWMQEIAWTMVNNPNLDHPMEKEELYIRSPFFDQDILGGKEVFKADPDIYQKIRNAFPLIDEASSFFEQLEAVKSPRIIKSHFCPSLLSPTLLENAKAIYIIRDPRDMCVSAHYFFKSMKALFQYDGDLEETIRICLKGSGLYGDMINHIRQWLPYKNHKNVHFVFYENLKIDTANELKKLDEFLGTRLTATQLDQIKNHVSFNEMKKQESFLNVSKEKKSKYYNELAEETGGFYRKGIVGDFKEKFSPKMNEMFTDYLKKYNELNLEYRYEEYQPTVVRDMPKGKED